LKTEGHLKIAYIFDFYCLFGIFIKKDSSKTYYPIFRLNLSLWPDTFSLNFATDSVLICKKLNSLLKALLLNWLKFKDSSKRLSRLDLFKTIKDIEGTENRKTFLTKLSFCTFVGDDKLSCRSGADCYLSKVNVSLINSQNLSNRCGCNFKKIHLS
jgi:hypothetical protein